MVRFCHKFPHSVEIGEGGNEAENPVMGWFIIVASNEVLCLNNLRSI